MPITARPDPNHPGQWIWVDSATGQPATQPGGAGTAYTAPSDQPTTTNVDIAPPGSAAPPTSTPAPASTTPAGPPSPGQPSAGGYTVGQITAQSDAELLQANADVAKLWDGIHTQQDAVAKLQADPATIANPALLTAATSQLNAQYQALSSAMQRVETANASRATVLQKAIDAATLDPAQVDLAKAQVAKANADADLAGKQGDVLVSGAQGQRDLVAAQATQASAVAAANLATAAATTAKTPAEVAQLQAQAAALNAQATSTSALIGPLVDKTNAETANLGAQSDQAKAQATLNLASAASANADAALKQAQLSAGLPAAQVTSAQAQAQQAQAAAAASQADIQKGLQGPLYGLQDQIKAIQAIQNQVFGPGGSGDPNEANDLLKQYVTATVSGTTPYAANVAAANAGLTAFGTQASLANAAQQAAASRANAYTGFGANALGTLAQMNANAPAGSTAMAGAFQDVMNQMQGRLQSPQFAGPQLPQAPPLPALLQNLAGMGGTPRPGATPGGPGPLPGVPAAAPAPPGLAFPSPTSAPQTGAPVTININGQGGQTPPPSPSLATQNAAGLGLPNPSQASAWPASIAQHAPATPDTVAQLWGKEIQSGIVRSPYAAMGQA